MEGKTFSEFQPEKRKKEANNHDSYVGSIKMKNKKNSTSGHEGNSLCSQKTNEQLIRSYLKKRKKALSKMSPKNDEKYKKLLKLYKDVIGEEIEHINGSSVPQNIAFSKHDLIDHERCNSTFLKFQEMLHALKFEWNYSVPSALAVVSYCTAHLSLYEILTNIIADSLKYRESATDSIHCILILLGFFLFRVSGGAWNWLNEDRYMSAKTELRRRICRSSSDARIQIWFKKRQFIRNCTHVLSFYLVYVGVIHFLCTVAFPHLFDSKSTFLQSLPSLEEDSEIITGVHKDLATSYHQKPLYPECNITLLDQGFMFNQTSTTTYYRVFGNPNAAVVTQNQTLMFYIFAAFFSLKVMKWIDVSIFE